MIASREYRKRLSKMRRNVYMGGQLIDRDHPHVSIEDIHRAFRWVQAISCSELAGVMQYAGVHGGGSPGMEQIAIMGSYNVEQTMSIAKRLAGITVNQKYSFDRFGVMPGER